MVNNYGTRKRTLLGLPRKKTVDMQEKMEEDLLAMQEVDREACWKIYRLDETNCQQHIPPQPKTRNCKQNPYCIHRLGLEKFDKLLQSQQASEILVRRTAGEEPCGLTNSGNFCYVNSFLQIWFNDLQFRQCIYDWRPSLEWVKPESSKLDIQEVMQCLQRLFITMQFTPFDSTNANEFIQLLRLDNEQQDVQEFHTLFFGTIERNLQAHPNGAPVLATIKRLFQSRITQTIKCGHCRRRNETDGEYRSLQIGIDGHDTLISAIQHFFEIETLEDFRCQCGTSGSVTRKSKFSELPEVLIIQLNRYVFESNGHHRKLKSAIHYPRTLPINELQQKDAVGGDYELCAVMIHEGPNTHCGHYYDLIRDPDSGQWFKYNDKEVLPEKRSYGYVGKPENFSRGSSDTKGCYALIYHRSSIKMQSKKLRLPPDNVVEEIINELELDFTRQSCEGTLSMELWISKIKSRSEFLHQLWAEMEVFDGRECVDRPHDICFLPTALFIDILTKEYKAVEEYKATDNEFAYLPELVDNVSITLCKHGCVPLEGVQKGELKAVHSKAALKLIDDFNVRLNIIHPQGSQNANNHEHPESSANGVPNGDGAMDENDRNSIPDNRLKTGADICIECVEAVRKGALFKNTLNTTEEHFSAILRKECLQDRTHDPTRSYPMPKLAPPENAVWVSLNHLKSFKKLALRQMEQDGKMFCCAEEEPTDKKAKGDDRSEDGEATGTDYQQKAEIICLDSDVPSTSKAHFGEFSPVKLGSDKNYNIDRFMGQKENYGSRPIPRGEIKPLPQIEEQENDEEGRERDGQSENGEMGGGPKSESGGTNNTGEPIAKALADGHIPRFNDDLLCKHQSLKPNTKRVWLTREEWGILSNNFFNCCEPIPCDAQECSECIEETQVLNVVKETSKKQLEDLLNDLNPLVKKLWGRKIWEQDELGHIFDHVICLKFVIDCRNCQQKLRCKNLPEIPKICQECLLCGVHSLPYLSLDDEFDKKQQYSSSNSIPIPITGSEWDHLVEVYWKHVPEHGAPIAILLQKNGQYLNFCDACHGERNLAEVKKRFSYPDGADIYVKLKGDESEEQAQAKASSSPTPTVMTRRVASKGLMKFRMKSHETIGDLKVKLYQRVNQSPVDQLLYKNDKVLDSNLTLQMAEVPSNNTDCPLVLIVQQRGEDMNDSGLGPSSNGPRQLEKGFKDTALSA